MQVRGLAVLPWLLAFVACTPVPVDNNTPPVDGDSDGFDVLVDCNDADANIHPEADESCDDVDNDCDGLVDEQGAVDAKTWYVDGDEDGFGDPLLTRSACKAPPFYVDNADDCDDAAGEVYPEADELCDGLDNDCDDEVDEEPIDARLFYWDFDGDGFGDLNRPERACRDEAWLVTDNTDCNDKVAGINPSATEQCDGTDNDCDTLVDDADPSVSADGFSQYYADGDADGFGNPDIKLGKMSCEPGDGYADNPTDCNDADPVVGECEGGD
jgi:hypothetical protein